jgi:hypothetical protein
LTRCGPRANRSPSACWPYKAAEQARQAHEGLTKAELSDQLAERGLPKSGNVDELMERLANADTE